MDIRMVLGINARRYRAALGLSQEAVGVRIGADRSYISAIERGTQNMTIVRLCELADGLEVSHLDLLAEPPSLPAAK